MRKFLIFFITVILVASTAFFCFAEAEMTTQKEVIAKKAGQPTPINFQQTGPFAILTPVIPENKAMVKFAIEGAPTWSNKNGDSDVLCSVYVWTGNYEDSTAAEPIYTNEVKDHKDNFELAFDLGLSCFAGNRYLLVLTLSNNGVCGYYSANEEEIEGWDFFCDGDNDSYTVPGFYVVWGDVDESMRPAGSEIVEIATPVPTQEPTAAPTAEPTAAPTAESTAQPTEAPENTGCGSAIGGGMLVVLFAAAISMRKEK